MRNGNARLLPVLLAAWVAVAAACDDIRSFEGRWEGLVSPDPALRRGFPENSVLALTVELATRTQLRASIESSELGTRSFLPIQGTEADALGAMRLPGEPLRTFLGYALGAPDSAPLTVVSLFAEERIDLRLIRGGNDLYGVFSLTRARARASAR